MTRDEERTISEAVIWLDEHAKYVDRAVIDGYLGIQDGLASLLPFDPRPILEDSDDAPA